jgi:protein-S-isoprenylcysteine O-methyltransferase Ste14
MNKRPILPPTVFNLAALLTIALHFVLPVWRFVHYPLNLIGLAPIVFGGVLNLWADQIFKKANTTVKPFVNPSALIVSGPFRAFRHPMYVGMLAILFGIAIVCGSVTSLAGPIAFWIVMRVRFIPAEEQSMMTMFGDDYRQYKKKVLSWM